MPIKEHDKVIQTEKNNTLSWVEINCDICDMLMYHNNTYDNALRDKGKFGFYICSTCARNVLKQMFIVKDNKPV